MSKSSRRRFLAHTLSGAALALTGSLAADASAQGFKPKLPSVGAKPATPAIAPPPGIKTFSKMPRNASEVAAAHLMNREEATEFLLGGEPLEFNGYALRLTKRDGAPLKNGKLPNPSTRRFMFSVGIELKKADQG